MKFDVLWRNKFKLNKLYNSRSLYKKNQKNLFIYFCRFVSFNKEETKKKKRFNVWKPLRQTSVTNFIESIFVNYFSNVIIYFIIYLFFFIISKYIALFFVLDNKIHENGKKKYTLKLNSIFYMKYCFCVWTLGKTKICNLICHDIYSLVLLFFFYLSTMRRDFIEMNIVSI